MNVQVSPLEVTPFANCPSLLNVPLALININHLIIYLILQTLENLFECYCLQSHVVSFLRILYLLSLG